MSIYGANSSIRCEVFSPQRLVHDAFVEKEVINNGGTKYKSLSWRQPWRSLNHTIYLYFSNFCYGNFQRDTNDKSRANGRMNPAVSLSSFNNYQHCFICACLLSSLGIGRHFAGRRKKRLLTVHDAFILGLCVRFYIFHL